MTEAPRLPGLMLADADWLARSALEVGTERGYPPLAAAVTDVTGEAIVLRRGDGGSPLTSRVALAKARSALIALMPSGRLGMLPAEIVDSLQHLYDGNLVVRAGGVLITRDDVILGAAGVSGATSDQDEDAILTAVERWQSR